MAATLMRYARQAVVAGARTLRTHQHVSPLVNAKQNYRCFSRTIPSQADRLLSEDHEWVLMDGKVGTVGISDHAQKETLGRVIMIVKDLCGHRQEDQLGDIVYVECPEVGRECEKGESVATVESVKAVTEVYTPVSGTITAVNESLQDAPDKVNKSCYDEGWLYKIELSNEDELKGLMTEEQYKKFLTDLE